MNKNVSGRQAGVELCEMKIASAEWEGGRGYSAFVQKIIIHLHTHTHMHKLPGDKHRNDSIVICFTFIRTHKCALCVRLLYEAQVTPQTKTNIKWCSKLEILFSHI